jgi:tripartite-type tricarboxylate transporter receptor subunit TctC
MLSARGFLLLSAWLSAVCLASPTAIAADNDYPIRPVKTIVPFAPGGPADVLARLLSQKLSEAFGGKAFVVENRAGAAGNIGIAQAAKAPPDGYTLLLASTAFVINPALYPNPGFDPAKDFTPITLAVSSPNILVVHPSFPAKDMREFLNVVKAAPGRHDFATPGVGTGPHLSAELFKLGAQVYLTHIPYNGGGPAIQAVLSGEVPICMSALPATVQHVKAGKLRPLAVTSSVRFASMPDVPTIAETGIRDFEGDTLQFVVAPSGTPTAIVERLHKEIAAALTAPDMREKLTPMGFLIVASTPAQTARRISLEQEKWARVIKTANIKPD